MAPSAPPPPPRPNPNPTPMGPRPVRTFLLIFTGLCLLPCGFMAGNYLHNAVHGVPPLAPAPAPAPAPAAAEDEAVEHLRETPQATASGVLQAQEERGSASDVRTKTTRTRTRPQGMRAHGHADDAASEGSASHSHSHSPYATAKDVERATRRAYVERELGSVRSKLEQLRGRRAQAQAQHEER